MRFAARRATLRAKTVFPRKDPAMHTKRDLTQGSIPRGLLGFALPLILGNLLQQLYNLADTWVVGQFIGEGALAAVG